MRNRDKETQWDKLTKEERPQEWIARAERAVTEKGDFREDSFPVWDGDDIYAIRITVANTGDGYGYGLRIFNESGDIIEHKAIMDKFVALIPHKSQMVGGGYVYLLKEGESDVIRINGESEWACSRQRLKAKSFSSERHNARSSIKTVLPNNM